MTCDRPIRDRSGEELPGVTCNLGKGHLGRCAMLYDAWGADPLGRRGRTGIVDGEMPERATVTPSEPSGQSGPSDPT